ncbi:putative galacturonosyltransferase 14-like protein, partial [Trifolium pratense]
MFGISLASDLSCCDASFAVITNLFLVCAPDCLGRRLGPRLLGRVDDSGRLVRDFYNILNEVKTGEIPADIKLPESFDKLVSDMQTNQYDAKTFAFMLRGM